MGHPLLRDVPCEDAMLCDGCVKRRVSREVASALTADRARIAQAIREEMPAADDPEGTRWRFGDGSTIDGSDVFDMLARLLRVVES